MPASWAKPYPGRRGLQCGVVRPDPDPPTTAALVAAKARLRRELVARRATRTDLASAAAALAEQLLAATWARAGAVVAAYVPIDPEPGSVQLLDALRDRGVQVLLPVVAGRALDWSAYDGALASGPWGLREPTGPRLGPPALDRADVVLVPALAVDRAGTRLGKGAGFYDRALPMARAGVPLIAVLHDGELLDTRLPAEPHDVAMTGAVTPTGGMVGLGAGPQHPVRGPVAG